MLSTKFMIVDIVEL